MKRPSNTELKKLLAQHGGNISASARSLRINRVMLQNWCFDAGLRGTGKGGAPSTAPPQDELRAAYDRHAGNLAALTKDLGVPRSTVRNWVAALGLKARGDEKFEPIYPMQLSLTVRDGHVAIYSDAHFWPAVKSRAYDGLLVALRKLKPKAVIGNGDLLDGAKISRHDPIGWDDLPTLEDELHEGQIRQAEIARAAPGAEKIGVIGNHDARLEKYVIKYARELEGVSGTRLADHFPGWKLCWSVKINDDVMVKHRMRGGVHAVYNNTLHAGLTIVTGHLHSQAVRAKTDYRGTRWGVDAGCLADPGGPQFLYLEANPVDWRSGFCVLTFENGKLLPPQLATVLDDGSVWWQRNERLV